MPIKRRDFQNGNFKTRYTDRTKHPVAQLLKKNVSMAFTVSEITKRTGMLEDTVRSMLRMLKADGLIVHKTPYFAWKK